VKKKKKDEPGNQLAVCYGEQQQSCKDGEHLAESSMQQKTILLEYVLLYFAISLDFIAVIFVFDSAFHLAVHVIPMCRCKCS